MSRVPCVPSSVPLDRVALSPLSCDENPGNAASFLVGAERSTTPLAEQSRHRRSHRREGAKRWVVRATSKHALVPAGDHIHPWADDVVRVQGHHTDQDNAQFMRRAKWIPSSQLRPRIAGRRISPADESVHVFLAASDGPFLCKGGGGQRLRGKDSWEHLCRAAGEGNVFPSPQIADFGWRDGLGAPQLILPSFRPTERPQ